MAVVAAAGLLLSVVALTTGDDAPEVREVRGDAAVSAPATSPRPGPGPTRPPAATVEAHDASLGAASTGRPPPPSRVQVPSIGLDATVRPVGVAEDRQMQLPDDPRVLGWYRFGAAPGERGSVVLAGHVDSRTYGVGPLVALQTVTAGARVELATGAGSGRTYRVDSIERFDQQALPATVFARTGPERLRIITCTGPYLPEQGGYQQNLVVTAVPVRG